MMTRRLLLVLFLGGLCVALTVSTALAVDRVSASEKGSLLVYPKVEVRWDPFGNVIQDTFIDITNDYPEDVYVQMFFVNGDAPAEMFPGDPPPCPGGGEPPVDPAIEAAIVQGLIWLAAQQNPDGSWDNYGHNRVAATGLAVLKFEDRAMDLHMDPFDPAYEYHQQVIDGLGYIISQSGDQNISGEPEADGDGDGIGTYFAGGSVYESGIAMMAIAASQHPEIYGDILQDALDWMAFAQNNPACGVHEGGWRYGANYGSSDSSTSGYATLGLGFAAAGPPYLFDLPIPAFVKTRLSGWLDRIQDPVNGDSDDGGSYYTPGGGDTNILRTGNLLYELGMVGDSAGSARVQAAIDYIERHWGDAGAGGIGWLDHRQAMFTMMKGLEGLGIELIDLNGDGIPEHDWFADVAGHLLATQNADGSWPYDPWASPVLSTAWALLTLEKGVPPLYGACCDHLTTICEDNVLEGDCQGPFMEWTEGVCCDELDPPCDYERAHLGCNWVDNMIELTANEPTFWSALSGMPKGTSPFTVLDPGFPPGRRDPLTGDRVLRGFIVAWAVDENGEEIHFNHLKGDALIVDYRHGSAWEYVANAFAALTGNHGDLTGTPGELFLDEVEYDACYGMLLLDFYAAGAFLPAPFFGGDDGQRGVMGLRVDTDLTLLPMLMDLRQDGIGLIGTKAKFDIWNMNEWKFSGTERCIECWDQEFLSQYDAPNHFLRDNLQTDKGKARIVGMGSAVCPDSVDTPLLGLAMKMLSFGFHDMAQAGFNLVGMGVDKSASIKTDVATSPPPEKPGEGDSIGIKRIDGRR